MKVICLWLLSAGVALADPLGANDYDALFEAHADKINVDAAGARALELDTGVTIYESVVGEERLYAGVDLNNGGAVGCLASLFIEVAAMAAACPDEVKAPAPEHIDQLLTYYAANSYPPADLTWVQDRFNVLVGQARDQLTQCGLEEDVILFSEILTGERTGPLLDDTLATPRLPVSNPCL